MTPLLAQCIAAARTAGACAKHEAGVEHHCAASHCMGRCDGLAGEHLADECDGCAASLVRAVATAVLRHEDPGESRSVSMFASNVIGRLVVLAGIHEP